MTPLKEELLVIPECPLCKEPHQYVLEMRRSEGSWAILPLPLVLGGAALAEIWTDWTTQVARFAQNIGVEVEVLWGVILAAVATVVVTIFANRSKKRGGPKTQTFTRLFTCPSQKDYFEARIEVRVPKGWGTIDNLDVTDLGSYLK